MTAHAADSLTEATEMLVWDDEPSATWVESLPIGNGRLGAMIPGNICHEEWALNEDSVWYGCASDRNPRDASKHLDQLRQFVAEDRIQEAETLISQAFVGMPRAQRHYEPLGQLQLDFAHPPQASVSNYKRKLDLRTAMVDVSYEIDEIVYNRQVFASWPHQVICSQFTASKHQSISASFRIFRGEECLVYMDSIEAADGDLILKATTGGQGVELCLVVRVMLQDGNMKTIGDTVVVSRASKVQILVAAETTFRHPDPSARCFTLLVAASELSYEQLVECHLRDIEPLLSQCQLHIESESAVELQNKPTKKLLPSATGSLVSSSLVNLYFHFGRYLLLSSSRPGWQALPANLQGIWNNSINPPWGSKFTLNINTEMNYWPAEVCNLSECHLPLFSHIERLRHNGRVTAKKMYNCRGWVAHHNTDLWADSAPQDVWLPSTLWPMGGAWLSLHIWEHYQFTRDASFLDQHYEIIKGSVEFFLDFLITHKGYNVTCPSLSPENAYRLPNGEHGHVCMAPTMDVQILNSLFDAYKTSTEILRKIQDLPFVEEVNQCQSRLPPLRVGRHDQLQEWLVDHDEVEPGHRHLSHLWGLYPGNQISGRTPILFEACKKSLDRRESHGGGHTGWSRAWVIALWARLFDGNRALHHISELFRCTTYSNLLSDHPPFQIDGNFGSIAAFAELLLQSHAGYLHLLPALPKSWAKGSVTGMCARGGFVVDIQWAEGHLIEVAIFSKAGTLCKIKYDDRHELDVKHEGESVETADIGGLLEWPTVTGWKYRVCKTHSNC